MDGDRTIDGGVVVSLQSGRLDVQLSLCHDPAAVDVSHLGGQRQVVGDRGRAFRRIGRDQRSRDLAVPVDREDTRMKRTRLPRMSPKQWSRMPGNSCYRDEALLRHRGGASASYVYL